MRGLDSGVLGSRLRDRTDLRRKCRALDLGAGRSRVISDLGLEGAERVQSWACKVSGWRTCAAWAWGAAAGPVP